MEFQVELTHPLAQVGFVMTFQLGKEMIRSRVLNPGNVIVNGMNLNWTYVRLTPA